VREEDRVTLRQAMFPETIPPELVEEIRSVEVPIRSEEEIRLFENLIEKMDLKDLLDLPLIALSNGQTRRARIVKAVLNKPQLLLLDEPLSVSSPFSFATFNS
jgi:ABC-type Mn2+/Zn2+ transport system ATPase subunit